MAFLTPKLDPALAALEGTKRLPVRPKGYPLPRQRRSPRLPACFPVPPLPPRYIRLPVCVLQRRTRTWGICQRRKMRSFDPLSAGCQSSNFGRWRAHLWLAVTPRGPPFMLALAVGSWRLPACEPRPTLVLSKRGFNLMERVWLMHHFPPPPPFQTNLFKAVRAKGRLGVPLRDPVPGL